MRYYKAIKIVTIRSGLVEMSEDQANARHYCAQPTDKKDVYSVTGQLKFKAGELFGCDGKVPQTHAESVSSRDPAAEAEAAAQAEAEAQVKAEAEAAAQAEAQRQTQAPPKKKSKG